MCDVCVAEAALSEGGAIIRWPDAPRNIPVVQVIAKGKGAEFEPASFKVRLTGASLTGDYVAKERKKLGVGDGYALPKKMEKAVLSHTVKLSKKDRARSKWSEPQRTKDLAGAMMRYGFDTAWPYVGAAVKAWLHGERKMPTLAELGKSGAGAKQEH